MWTFRNELEPRWNYITAYDNGWIKNGGRQQSPVEIEPANTQYKWLEKCELKTMDFCDGSCDCWFSAPENEDFLGPDAACRCRPSSYEMPEHEPQEQTVVAYEYLQNCYDNNVDDCDGSLNCDC